MTSRQKNQNDARQAYESHQTDIARLIDVLQMELAKHADVAKATCNWGHVGEVAATRSSLIDLVAGVAGLERTDVETFLNDAE